MKKDQIIETEIEIEEQKDKYFTFRLGKEEYGTEISTVTKIT